MIVSRWFERAAAAVDPVDRSSRDLWITEASLRSRLCRPVHDYEMNRRGFESRRHLLCWESMHWFMSDMIWSFQQVSNVVFVGIKNVAFWVYKNFGKVLLFVLWKLKFLSIAKFFDLPLSPRRRYHVWGSLEDKIRVNWFVDVLFFSRSWNSLFFFLVWFAGAIQAWVTLVTYDTYTPFAMSLNHSSLLTATKSATGVLDAPSVSSSLR